MEEAQQKDRQKNHALVKETAKLKRLLKEKDMELNKTKQNYEKKLLEKEKEKKEAREKEKERTPT